MKNKMTFILLSLSTLLLTTTALHGMETTTAAEQPTQMTDYKTALTADILACNVEQCKETLASAPDAQISPQLRAQLLALAQQLRALKETEKARCLDKKNQRILAGLCAVPNAVLTITGLVLFVMSGHDDIEHYSANKLNGKIITTFGFTLAFLLLAIYSGRIASQDIYYALYAGTEQLTTDIAALDEIIDALSAAR